VTYVFTDPDRDRLHITPTTRYGHPAINLRTERGDGQGGAAVDIPLDRLEELIAGLRDTARQATTQ
jgi:hypothetical protein